MSAYFTQPLSKVKANSTRGIKYGFQPRRVLSILIAAFCTGSVAQASPTIESIAINPNPLVMGESFAISVATSPDVTQATAIFEFHRSSSSSLKFSLLKQGNVWVGTNFVPTGLDLRTNKDEAKVRVLAFDAVGRRDEKLLQVNVVVPPVTASFSNGVLTVTGDDSDNTIVVSRDAAGALQVNGGSVFISGSFSTVANTSLIRVFGLNGNDLITISDANGPMPPANLIGGEGDDTLTGSANADQIEGGTGNDTLLGKAGDDYLFGGPGTDTLIGGQGVDQIFGGEDDDQILWNPGDGSDVVEGENGEDTLLFAGANVSETVDILPNGQRLKFVRNIGNITMDCAGIEKVLFRALSGSDIVNITDLTGTEVKQVVVDLGAAPAGDTVKDTVQIFGTDGDDHLTLTASTNEVSVTGLSATITVTNPEFAVDELIVNGLGGADIIDASAFPAGLIDLTLNGGSGDDMLIGGDADDVLIGGQGVDHIVGGAGDDVLIWNPGDSNDLFEGGSGQDSLQFNGSNINEEIDLSAQSSTLRLTRNISSIILDCIQVEQIDINARGGADKITVNDLSGTGATTVNIDLAQISGSNMGDNAADAVIVNGTNGDDVVKITGAVSIRGLAAAVNIMAADPFDQLFVQLQDGSDVADATELLPAVITLTMDGGRGDDVLIGSPGNDFLFGGEGDDVLKGGSGLDILDGGPGSNILIQD